MSAEKSDLPVDPAEPRAETAMGLSGRIARSFLTTQITPLLAFLGLLLGVFAVLITPREEEPQIAVTFANVFIPFPGASVSEVESLVTTPAEQLIMEIEGVEHVYSISQPGLTAITVRFTVGESRNEAIVRLYNAIYSNQDWIPPGVGVGQPLIKPKGIDDVPIAALTLWNEDGTLSADELQRVANSLSTQLQRIPGTRDIELIGGPERVVRVLLNPARLAVHDLTVSDIRRALNSANASADAGHFTTDNQSVLVQAGTFLTRASDVADLVVGVNQGAPVFLRDVADVQLTPDTPESWVTHGLGPASAHAFTGIGQSPAVTLSIGKKPGENAVTVADNVISTIAELRGIVIPDAVQVDVTRNYGATAEDKAQTLIKKLIFATLSVVILVGFALGWREALVVGAAVIVTLALTLFASWAWGFTINRVSLFALIFSIGILVDDAIVVVENIHRHLVMGGKSLNEAIPLAVDEVGGPTILATFTVIAALLPMAFVTGLMGPYMRPIPINASSGMLISLAVAFIFTPWLYRRLFSKVHAQGDVHATVHGNTGQPSRSQRLFTRIMRPFLRGRKGRTSRTLLLLMLIILIIGSIGLVGMQAVILKMLPFDNKSEFQVVVDMPEGTPAEETYRVLLALADEVRTIPEVTDYQIYTATSAPINFNGLVRQYYLRRSPHQGDLQVNLQDKHDRHRASHEIALATRKLLAPIGAREGATVKVVEVPPGPPVLSPLVAELYGLDSSRLPLLASKVRAVFEQTSAVVDIDDNIEAKQKKLIASIDRARAASLGISQADVVDTIAAAMRGTDMSWLHDDLAKQPIPVRIELSDADKADPDALADLRVRSLNGALVPLSEITRIETTVREQSIQHKDLQPVMYVMGDVAGESDSPLYGMAAIAASLDDISFDGQSLQQYFIKAPQIPIAWSLKWDGEWQVTYETFRDMGIAYAAGLLVIYLLVVAQFRSYGVPLIIMAPIPLTLIGIMPGHALLQQPFTAPSMIGMIALAGIIVRNSILLVDFIEQEVASGKGLQEATINAVAVRALPIILTALAAMMGGFFIIDDPIFGGLAVSLIFGLLVSTLLTLLVIPVVYYAYHYRKAVVA